MQKILNFDTHYDIDVMNENIKGFLLDFKTLKDDGAGNAVVCDIADYNKILCDIILERNGREIKMHDGYLEDLLIALYGQTPAFGLNKKKTTTGYLVKIDFSPFLIHLRGNDKLKVRFRAQKTAFVGTNLSMSSIEFVSLTAKGESSSIPVVKSHVIGKDEVSLDMNLGDGILKIVAATDYSTGYLASAKAKVESMELRARDFEKSVNENVLLAENMHYLDQNPDTDVEDLVLHWDKKPLNGVKLKGKLTKPAEVTARVITLGVVRAH